MCREKARCKRRRCKNCSIRVTPPNWVKPTPSKATRKFRGPRFIVPKQHFQCGFDTEGKIAPLRAASKHFGKSRNAHDAGFRLTQSGSIGFGNNQGKKVENGASPVLLRLRLAPRARRVAPPAHPQSSPGCGPWSPSRTK